MTRSGENKPAPPKACSPGRSLPRQPARGPANAEAFGRFLRNLARLEGGAARAGKAGERAR
ncbi:MAG: hypothetical protein B7Z40_05155 [Bosea sp. 12-68-7]|nr:MAG: hypothetical protein B7Z40_05155 [Bosea sp. 12-68-7]